MSRRNKAEEEARAKLAALAIGAVGYGAYKLFETVVDLGKSQANIENTAQQSNSKMVPPKIISVPNNYTHQFSRDSKIYLVNTVEECRYAMNDLKS